MLSKPSLRKLSALLGIVVLGLLVGGCKNDETSVGPTGEVPRIVNFTASPSSVQAGGDSVLLSWKVTGATSVSIAPNVGTVTPPDSGARKVFVSATTAFVLTATNATGSVRDTEQVTVAAAISVNGFVKDYDGEPISGVAVIVKGKSPVVTSSNGAFSVSGVTPPYEISVILSTQQTAIVYKGLTRSDPTLLYFSSLTATKSATISGSVPAAAGKVTRVFFVSGLKSWYVDANAGTGAYTINAQWKGSTNSYTGKLYALRWTAGTNGFPSVYDAVGQKDLTISAGGTFTSTFVTGDLTDPPDQTIAGSITRPTTSYTLYQKSLYLNFGNAFVYIASESGGGLTDNFSYNVPAITGATFGVDAYAQESVTPTARFVRFYKTGIAGGSSGVTISLASAPQLNLPAHNGTNIDTTTQFLWAAGGGAGVNRAVIVPTVSGRPTYYIFTASNSISIPNFSPQGLGLPSNAGYTWQVEQYYPVSSIDNVAADSFLPFVYGNGGDAGLGRSETFNFTTRP